MNEATHEVLKTDLALGKPYAPLTCWNPKRDGLSDDRLGYSSQATGTGYDI